MERFVGELTVDGRTVKWASIPHYQKSSDTKETIEAEVVENLKLNGAKRVVVIR